MIENRSVPVEVQGKTLALAANVRLVADDLIVFMHGLACTKACFDGAFESAALRDYSLCAFDFAGFGESAKPENFSYRLEDHADAALALIGTLPAKRVFVAGHSMGGGIGLLVAQKLPNLGGFIGIEGLLGGGTYSRRIASQSEQEFLAAGYEVLHEELRTSPDPALRQWAELYSQADARATYRSACSMVAWADSGKLFAIINSLPHAAYLHGDRTPMDAQLPLLRGVAVHPIARSGHFIMWDNPDGLYSGLSRLI